MDDDGLVAEATAARELAYAPYSGYAVGAALLDASGGVHRGCNVENASYPVGVCAERTALVSAVAAGQRRFLALAVVVDAAEPAAPCGLCRQALAELAPDLRVVMATTSGARRLAGLEALLPLRFGPTALGAPAGAGATGSGATSGAGAGAGGAEGAAPAGG